MFGLLATSDHQWHPTVQDASQEKARPGKPGRAQSFVNLKASGGSLSRTTKQAPEEGPYLVILPNDQKRYCIED